MAQVMLKKLLGKGKAISSVIYRLIDAADAPIGIKDGAGQLLLGEDLKTPTGKYPVEIEDQTLGWVIGGKQAADIAALLALMAHRELEKKTLANEVLDNYRELNLLYNLSEKMGATLDLDAVAQLVIDEAGRLITASDGAIILHNDQRESLEIIAAFGQTYQPQSTIQFDKGIIGTVNRSGKAEIINNVLSDLRFSDCDDDKIDSLVCAPLKVRQKVIGMIVIGNQEPTVYSAAHLKLLNTIASQAAPAIENALLFQKERKAAEERERKLKQQIMDLRIELDDAKQQQKVAEITETDYFRRLEAKAHNLRAIMEGNEHD